MARRAVCALAGRLALTAVAGAVAAPPTNVCAVCQGEFDGASTPGTLDIYPDDEGSTRWVERVPVTRDTAREVRENTQRCADVVDDAWARCLVTDDSDVTNQSSTVDGSDGDDPGPRR